MGQCRITLVAALAAGMTGLVACSAAQTQHGFDDGSSGGASAQSSSATTTTTTTGAGGSLGTGSTGAGASGGTAIAEVYGASADTLYRVDPDTNAVTVVGPFDGCTDVIDIALDKSSNMVATTSDGLYQIDKQTAACTLIQYGSYPNSLSYVPEGTVDPNEEALVGYLDSSYVRIDPTTGDVTTIGELSGGYYSSGDLVSVLGGKTLLTVKGNGCNDCVIEVNPATGDLVKDWGPIGATDVFGLAFWAGSAYAFSDGGQLIEVTFQSALATKPITIPMAPAALSFWGAGSTTHAPPNPIPK